jgi:hypothetical protein
LWVNDQDVPLLEEETKHRPNSIAGTMFKLFVSALIAAVADIQTLNVFQPAAGTDVQ